ncbi:MAG: transglutaminase domain-containing protein, partial [Faecousia sp.]
VFYPRVNSENIEDCRGFFYRQLAPQVEGLAETEAILEINRWCAEQVTYQASNDRTESPLTAYRSGTGRCGEESTFTVTALRSMGIPARQIYVPFWAHCDDNHAWVEVFANGRWHFLGACEPEPVLDRGWFTDAASRAPLACYRRFFDFAGPGMASEQCIAQQGCCLMYNVIDHYAPASDLTIRVCDADGTPVPGAKVRLDVVNAAAFCPVASLVSDSEGLCRVRLGHVSVHIEVWTDTGYGSADITISGETHITLTPAPLDTAVPPVSFDCFAPPSSPVNRTVLTSAQQAENSAVLSHCTAMRTARIQGYYLREYDALDDDWQKILHLAAGNASELYSLYQSAAPEQRPVYKAMLLSMETKDYRDTPAALLQEHLQAAWPFRDAPHFVEEILCPRLRSEMLECWRGPIAAAFSEAEKERFVRDPRTLMTYIEDTYTDGDLRYYPTLSVQPTAALKLGHADEQGRRLLFVAVLRTLGVPARINPIDEGAEFFRDGVYHSAAAASAPTAALRLIPQEGKRFVYANNFSLSRLEGRGYRPLHCQDSADSFCLTAAPGAYRLLTSNRLPNGSQQCHLTHFILGRDETVHIPLVLREPAPEEMLGNSAVDAFHLRSAEGKEIASCELLHGLTVLIYLDVSKEPTEHILNEIISAAAALRQRLRRDLRLIYVLSKESDRSDPTLQKALAAVPEAQIFFDSSPSDAVMLARKLFLEPGILPLLLLTDPSHRGYYGTCGYQVGTLELTLKLADCIPQAACSAAR